jgi:transcriptional regulator with XRE-family HTH domain
MTLSPAGTGTQDFSARIRLLIERVGSARVLAQVCGVTARTVRNWRNGHGDVPRERCLVLARALGISPLWLICGEGSMEGDMAGGPAEHVPPATHAPTHWAAGVDSERLAAALQVLQSYIVLAGGSLNLAQRAEAIVELYEMLAQPGPSDPGRLVAFHKTLATYLRSNRQALIA